VLAVISELVTSRIHQPSHRVFAAAHHLAKRSDRFQATASVLVLFIDPVADLSPLSSRLVIAFG
jgi:hypothetical protein